MDISESLLNRLQQHQADLHHCQACPQMIGPVVTGNAVVSKVMLIGQAPGDREGKLGRPFAWTAGKTLFGWFEGIGIKETLFRENVYMAAVCRCFPGKKAKGGDRVPDEDEIESCNQWLQAEYELLQPELIIPVGKLATNLFLDFKRLKEVIGQVHAYQLNDHPCQVIPLPHPSGASTWHRTEPGKSLLEQALRLISEQQSWRALLASNKKTTTDNIIVDES